MLALGGGGTEAGCAARLCALQLQMVQNRSVDMTGTSEELGQASPPPQQQQPWPPAAGDHQQQQQQPPVTHMQRTYGEMQLPAVHRPPAPPASAAATSTTGRLYGPVAGPQAALAVGH